MTIHLPDSLQSFLQQRVQEEAHKNLEEYIVKLVEGDRDRVQSGHLQDFLAQVSKDSNISEASSERKQELEKLILYRVRAESLEVLHFLHGSRDIAQVLDDS